MAKGQTPRPQLAAAAAVGILVLVHGTQARAQEPTEPAPAITTPPIAPTEPAVPITPAAPPPELPPPTTTDVTPPPADLAANPNRTVGGHQFIFPQFVDSSFVATYFGLRIRLAEFRAPNLPTQFGPIDITAVNFSQGFDLGIRIFDWLGLYGSTGVRSLISTNLKSLVYQGATFDLGANGGFIVRLLHNDRTGTRIALRGQAGIASGQSSSLIPLFQAANVRVALSDILQGNAGESIRTPFHSSNYGGTLTAAQAISPMFGLQAAAGVGYQLTTLRRWNPNTATRQDIDVNGVTYRFGLAASVDFNPLKVPIAIMAEYLVTRQASASSLAVGDDLDDLQDIFAGIYYSGRPNLQLGLGVGGELNLGPSTSPEGRSEKPHVLFSQFVLRYVW